MRILTTMPIHHRYYESVIEKYPNIHFVIKENMEEAKPFLKEVEILLTYGFDTEAEHIKEVENLKWIHVMSAGVDQMPFEIIKKKEIFMTNTRGIHKIPMSEYVMGVILDYERKTFPLYNQQKNKQWMRKRDVGEIYGKTIVVLGTGSIGQEIARKAKVFDMETIGVNTSGESVEYFDHMYSKENLNEAISKGDFIIAVLPLTPETRGFVGKEQFESMKPNAYFVNIARGPVVDEQAMIKVLQDKKIGGAALDVFEQEPLSSANPLWNIENVIITPHVSGVTSAYMDRAFPMFKQNLEVYLNHGKEYINMVDLDKKY